MPAAQRPGCAEPPRGEPAGRRGRPAPGRARPRGSPLASGGPARRARCLSAVAAAAEGPRALPPGPGHPRRSPRAAPRWPGDGPGRVRRARGRGLRRALPAPRAGPPARRAASASCPCRPVSRAGAALPGTGTAGNPGVARSHGRRPPRPHRWEPEAPARAARRPHACTNSSTGAEPSAHFVARGGRGTRRTRFDERRRRDILHRRHTRLYPRLRSARKENLLCFASGPTDDSVRTRTISYEAVPASGALARLLGEAQGPHVDGVAQGLARQVALQVVGNEVEDVVHEAVDRHR